MGKILTILALISVLAPCGHAGEVSSRPVNRDRTFSAFSNIVNGLSQIAPKDVTINGLGNFNKVYTPEHSTQLGTTDPVRAPMGDSHHGTPSQKYGPHYR